MPARCPRLAESFLASPVVDMNGYPYFVNPVSDGVPRMAKELLDEVADAIVEVSELDCDLILAPEAMGVPLAAAVTERTGIPYTVIRKRSYGLPGEIGLDQRTGYSKSPMYINDVSAGEKVAVIDDVISTGGTLRAVIGALSGAGAAVTEATAVFSKNKDIDALSRNLGVRINCLLAVSSEGGKPSIREIY